MWLVVKNSILTRDNLLHRGSKGPKKCVFCGLDESIDHLFLQCCVARFVWRVMWCTFNISQIPTSMQQMCDWIYSFNSKNMKLPAISIAALCWKILKTGKLACFRSKYPSDPTNLVLPLDCILGGYAENWCQWKTGHRCKDVTAGGEGNSA